VTVVTVAQSYLAKPAVTVSVATGLKGGLHD
jgi:hypothetical protein